MPREGGGLTLGSDLEEEATQIDRGTGGDRDIAGGEVVHQARGGVAVGAERVLRPRLFGSPGGEELLDKPGIA